MQIGSKRVGLATGAATIMWLVGVTLVGSGTGVSTTAETAALKNPGAKALASVRAACGNEYTQAAGRGAQPPAATTTAPRPEQVSEEAFKNVQLLKGIPVDEFMGTMGLFSAALGMCCLECHVEKWEEDTPRKRTSRRMIQMMDTLNRTNFSGRKVVTCWTCHRQTDKPQVTPLIDVIYGEPIYLAPDDLFQQTPGAPKPEDVLDKYIQAIGGAERIARITSISGKGIASGYAGSLRSPAEIFAKAPNQRTTIIHSDDGDKTMTYDGKSGWLASPVTPVPVMTLTGGELDGVRLDGELTFPGRIRQALTQWRANLPASLNGRPVNVLQGTGTGGLTATLYFDTQSGLLTRVVRYANSAMGRVPTQIDFDDYRDVSGVKFPFKWSFAWTSGRDVFELSEVQANVAIDAAKFAKPKAAVSKIR